MFLNLLVDSEVTIQKVEPNLYIDSLMPVEQDGYFTDNQYNFVGSCLPCPSVFLLRITFESTFNN
jgi:hypothetical protein